MNKGKIDINTIIGFLLIGGIFLYFGYFNQNEQPEATETLTQDSTAVEEKLEEEQGGTSIDTNLAVVGEDSSKQIVVPVAEERFTLENDKLELVFSNKGGQLVQARLKKYQTYDSLPLYLVNENSDFNIKLQGNEVVNTAEMYFSAVHQSDDELELTLNLGGGKSLTYNYSIQPDDYVVQWHVSSSGLGRMISSETGLQWELKGLRHEKNRDNENQYTRLKFLHSDDDIDELSATGEDSEDVQKLQWVAYRQQFFSSILFKDEGDFDKAAVSTVTYDEDQPEYLKYFVSKVSLADGANDFNTRMGLYLGPNKYDLLKSYGREFDELIPLGWGIFGWINRGIVINVFNWLDTYGLNYGLIILIMAVAIKLVLFPLTYQSYRSMAKMRVLKPEIDELNEKFKDKEPMKKQQAMMELYQKAGVNPLGGCIPVLLQLPILVALFRFFPASIELRQQPFLWATDLSTYDSIAQLPFNIPFYGDHVSLFTLLMTVSTLIYTYMNNQLTGSNQQYPQMKYMMYMMPIIFLGVFNNYAAGLSYYYFIANVITFGQQFFIRSTLNDEKIHAQIQAKKEKPKKENRFMRRMKEVQEEQNRQARRRKN